MNGIIIYSPLGCYAGKTNNMGMTKYKDYSTVQTITGGITNTISTGLTTEPRIVQMWDENGVLIGGLLPEISFNGTTYDIEVTPDITIDNVKFNVLSW